MKRTSYFIPTLKEKPNDIDQIGQVLMFRSGMLKKAGSGFFVYLPLMERVIQKVSEVIRKSMESANSVEIKFPILVTKETLEASGRWDAFGKEMFRLFDRHENEFAISPTNEEAACFVADTYLKSYKDLPFSLYQIQQKHRDEISPRNGVMRAREFIMKDAYSFHADEKCLGQYYELMHKTYLKIFSSLGIDVVSVSADTGAMGGSGSQEIMAVSADGETDICRCKKCGYGANAETVPCTVQTVGQSAALKSGVFHKVHTPNVRTIEELVKFFQKDIVDFCKSMVFNADGELVVALVRGDREVNEIKLKKILKANQLELATPAEIVKSGKTSVGYVGPVNLKGLRIFADNEVAFMHDFIVGANEKEYHLSGVTPQDFMAKYADIRFAADGEFCPECGSALEFHKATELGHIFKLGKRYTDKLNLQFVTKSGAFETMTMGCYGIGVERTIASIVDQHRDERGIVWPVQIAPFEVDLITVDITNSEQIKISKKLYEQLTKAGIDVLWDDTDARPGSKFADCELVGFPIRIVVGRGIADGKIEMVVRSTGEKTEIAVDDCKKVIKKKLKELRKY